GIRPLIAHPERNREIIQDPRKLAPFIDQGCLAQLTGASLTGRFGEGARQAAEYFLREGQVSYLASDAHNTSTRPPAMAEARRIIARLVGEETAEALAFGNPLQLVAHQVASSDHVDAVAGHEGCHRRRRGAPPAGGAVRRACRPRRPRPLSRQETRQRLECRGGAPLAGRRPAGRSRHPGFPPPLAGRSRRPDPRRPDPGLEGLRPGGQRPRCPQRPLSRGPRHAPRGAPPAPRPRQHLGPRRRIQDPGGGTGRRMASRPGARPGTWRRRHPPGAAHDPPGRRYAMTQAARHPQPRHQSGPRWYAVRTKPRQEGRARANLENQGFAVYLPHTWLDRRKAGRWQRVREVLFPGYLFIAVDAAHQAMAPIRSTPGVLDLVRQGTEPLPVAGAIIEQLHTAEAKLGEG